MYAGQMVETRRRPTCSRAAPPYTEALLASLPERDAGRRRLALAGRHRAGRVDRPAGCLLSPRCPYVQPRCRAERPPLFEVGASLARCFFPIGAEPRPMTDAPPRRRCSRSRRSTKHYFVARGASRRGDRPCARRRVALARSRAHARHGRRIGLRQEHAGAPDRDARDAERRQRADRRRRCAQADAAARGALRRTVQMVFQNPFASLNPRKKIGQALEEPLAINTRARPARARGARPRDAGARRPARPSTTAAIRTCSRAASASASRSPAR